MSDKALRNLIAGWRAAAAKDRLANAELNRRLRAGETVEIAATTGPFLDLRETCADELEAALAASEPPLANTEFVDKRGIYQTLSQEALVDVCHLRDIQLAQSAAGAVAQEESLESAEVIVKILDGELPAMAANDCDAIADALERHDSKLTLGAQPLSEEQVRRARYLEKGLRHVPPYYEHIDDETLTENLNALLRSKAAGRE